MNRFLSPDEVRNLKAGNKIPEGTWPCVECMGDGCLRCRGTGVGSRADFMHWYRQHLLRRIEQIDSREVEVIREYEKKPLRDYYDVKFLKI